MYVVTYEKHDKRKTKIVIVFEFTTEIKRWRKWWFEHNGSVFLGFVLTRNKIIIKEPTRKDTIGFGQNDRHLHYPTSSLLSHLKLLFLLFYSSRNFLITIITTKLLYVNDKKKKKMLEELLG